MGNVWISAVTFCILSSCVSGYPPAPDSYWQVSPPINENDTLYAGWKQIPEEHIIIYNGSEVGRTYAHHPSLYVVGNIVYLIHSSSPVDEDQMGEEVWAATSLDGGKTWGPSRMLLPEALLPNQTSALNFTYWCDLSIWQRGLGALQIVQVGDDIYGVSQTTDFFCAGSLGSDTRGAGRIARAMDKYGLPTSDPCWVAKNNWTDVLLYNETIYGTKYGMKYCRQAREIQAILETPAHAPAWSSWIYNHKLYAADGKHNMQENTHALWIEDDTMPIGGYWQRFWRDISSVNISAAVWVEYSNTTDGSDWYPKLLRQYGNPIYQTNIPDGRSKQYLGRLDTGDRYFVSNPRNDSTAVSNSMRQPLTIAMSRGKDLAYRRVGVLRTNASTNIVPGLHKNPGFSYPSAVQLGDKLLVAYSENKQNIWVSSVNIGNLP